MGKTRIAAIVLMAVLLAALARFGVVNAAPVEATDWVWISSNDKYSKFYSPSEVHILSSLGGVATRIDAWTKTTYSYEGAAETLQNYGIKVLHPEQLAYSLAEVEVNPQNRIISYVQETFYDKDGTVLWSKVYDPRSEKEINSQAFDEDFYTAIVDTVFHYGETERRKAQDRWITLWDAKAGDGSGTNSIADTTTMRLKGENLIFWEWVENKGADGKVKEIKFLKKAVNLAMGTQRIVNFKYWSGQTGWKDMTGELDGTYTLIKEGSHEYAGLTRLRAFATGYQYWLNRYRLV